jgi:hypothetical protein
LLACGFPTTFTRRLNQRQRESPLLVDGWIEPVPHFLKFRLGVSRQPLEP